MAAIELVSNLELLIKRLKKFFAYSADSAITKEYTTDNDGKDKKQYRLAWSSYQLENIIACTLHLFRVFLKETLHTFG